MTSPICQLLKTREMIFNLRVIEAKDLPKMDINGKADPYCKIYLSTNSKDAKHTKKLKKTLTPVFNDVFTFDVTNFSPSDYIFIKLKDQDPVKAEDISTINLPIIEYELGKVYDLWKDMTPAKGVKKGGQIHLVIHISLAGEEPFVDTSAQKEAQKAYQQEAVNQTTEAEQSPESSDQQIQITQPEQPNQPPEESFKSVARPTQPEIIEEEEEELPEIYDYGYFSTVNVTPSVEGKKELDYSKYHVSILSFNNDVVHIEDRSENVGAELALQLLARGMPVKSDVLPSSINSITQYFDSMEEEPKSLLLCVASSASTSKLRIIQEAYNEANFIIPDVDGNSPISSKIIDNLEECAEIQNSINLADINDSLGSLFKLSHDNDRYIFNYLYAIGLSNVGKKIGGCVFIETPLVETVQLQTQIDSIVHLLEALLELPNFN